MDSWRANESVTLTHAQPRMLSRVKQACQSSLAVASKLCAHALVFLSSADKTRVGLPWIQMGVSELCKPVQGDFLKMPFKDNTFDAAYAIEATCHAAQVSWTLL